MRAEIRPRAGRHAPAVFDEQVAFFVLSGLALTAFR
jgi:hypothetical protein